MLERLNRWWHPPARRAQAEAVALTPEFAQSCAGTMLEGCADHQGTILRTRLGEARHPQDLFHLRPVIYDCVARRFGEPEARRRLAWLASQIAADD